MNRQIAACGLDCGSCEILRVPTDPEAARSVTDWFRRMGWIGEGEGVEDVVRKAPPTAWAAGAIGASTGPPTAGS